MVPYFVSYLIVGVLFAVSLLINGRLGRGSRVRGVLLTLLIWPLIVLVAPESFLEKPVPEREGQADPLQLRLRTALRDDTGRLSVKLNQSLARAAKQGEQDVTYFVDSANFGDILGEYWDAHIPPAALDRVRQARHALVVREDGPLPSLGMQSRRSPDWLVGFSTEFLKSISHTDAKLRGRILDAVGKISMAPTEPVGDTIKPLSGSTDGMWRYRIGDHRLVYLPDAQTKKITLLFFGSRGDVYSQL